jgi:hypothetical protein
MVIITPKNDFADTIDSEKVRLNLFKEMFCIVPQFFLYLFLRGCTFFSEKNFRYGSTRRIPNRLAMVFRSVMASKRIETTPNICILGGAEGPLPSHSLPLVTCHSCCFYCYCSYFYHDLCFSAHA